MVKSEYYDYDSMWKDQIFHMCVDHPTDPQLDYTITYSFDDSGNVISMDDSRGTSNDRTFDWEGRSLISQTIGSNSFTYTYNQNGIRDSKTINSTTTTYYLDGALVLYETDGTNQIYYTYDVDGSLISMRYNGTEYFYMFDVFGNVSYLIDSSGYIVVEYRYDSYGNITFQTSSALADANPYRYRGYRYDQESGLYYLQSRYYNPETGRFINADGMLKASNTVLGHNMFTYTENNPVMNTDPTGYIYCFMNANQDVNSNGCIGGGRGSSPFTNYHRDLQRINHYWNVISNIYYLLQSGEEEKAYLLFMAEFPFERFSANPIGTVVYGLYGSVGAAAAIGSIIIPLGGTIGIQLAIDPNGTMDFQMFLGVGVHVIPHMEAGAFIVYYPDMSSTSYLLGGSIQLNASLFRNGLIGEQTFNGYQGFGYAMRFAQISFPFPIPNGNLIAEYQYTWSFLN